MRILDPRPLLLAVAVLPIAAAAASDPRSTEVLTYRCSNELGRRDVTLFANGTVRLREGLWSDQQLYLDELLPEELASTLAKLRSIAAVREPRSVRVESATPRGLWLERCALELALDDAEPLRFEFAAGDVPALWIKNLIDAAEELAEFTTSPDAVERLPAGYRPRPGDVLRTAEGERFRVLRLTSAGEAVELIGIGIPLRMLMAVEELDDAFAELED